MPERAVPRFDPEELAAMAGSTTFARGQAYARKGLVEILAIEPDRVVASVAGTEDYRTTVTGEGEEIDGTCTCPAYAREGFCKHIVAVALAANAALDSGEIEAGGAFGRIRAYLETMSVERLARMVVEIAERDPDLLRRLDTAAMVAKGDDKTVAKGLRKAIRDATRVRDYIDYWEAGDWAAGVAAALDPLADAASGPRASLVVELADYASDRIEAAIEAIDDSDGYCSELLYRAREIHHEACLAAGIDPIALAGDLFRRELDDGYGFYSGSATDYEDVLGETGLAEYRRLAQIAWDAEKDGAVASDDEEFDKYRRERLANILDLFAERDGDVETRIELRKRDLSSVWKYKALAEFCRDAGREEEALRWAEEGLWLFEDDRSAGGLLSLVVDLMTKAGRDADARALLWMAFEKDPDWSLYERLRELEGEKAVARAIELVRAELDKSGSSRPYWSGDFLIEILSSERMYDDAWKAVREYGASESTQLKLARACEATHPQEALGIYAEKVDLLARLGGNPNYEEAVELIGRMAGLRDAEDQAAYVVALKKQYKRKRNLMKLLG